MACVYTTPAGLCPGTYSLSKREHYLPRGLGNFKNDERLTNRICLNCQRIFRNTEDVFIHSSPEGFFREMIGQVGRKRKKKKNIFYEPTFAIPPLTVTATPPGSDVPLLWEMLDEQHCTPLKQIIFRGADNRFAHVAFRPGALSEQLIASLVKSQQVGSIREVIMLGSPEDAEEMDRITRALVPKGHVQDLPLGIEEGQRLEAEMRALVSLPYQRAIAKIGFHFFLQHFPRFTGFEHEFDAIKTFIYSGEGDAAALVRRTPHGILHGLGNNMTLRQWTHLLCCDCDEQGIRARVQFFAGPKVVPFIWEIDIGRNPSRIIYHEAVGVAFTYYDHLEGEFHGEKHPLLKSVTHRV